MSSENRDAERLRFPRARRLTRSSEFLQVKNAGRVQRGGLLMLGFLDLAEECEFRVGFVTSKRVRNAVARNRVRRRLREIIRLHQAEVRRGIWMVLIARSPAAHASYHALEDEWLRLAKRALILAPTCS